MALPPSTETVTGHDLGDSLHSELGGGERLSEPIDLLHGSLDLANLGSKYL